MSSISTKDPQPRSKNKNAPGFRDTLSACTAKRAIGNLSYHATTGVRTHATNTNTSSMQSITLH